MDSEGNWAILLTYGTLPMQETSEPHSAGGWDTLLPHFYPFPKAPVTSNVVSAFSGCLACFTEPGLTQSQAEAQSISTKGRQDMVPHSPVFVKPTSEVGSKELRPEMKACPIRKSKVCCPFMTCKPFGTDQCI